MSLFCSGYFPSLRASCCPGVFIVAKNQKDERPTRKLDVKSQSREKSLAKERWEE
jgi:hypothetical protein